MIRGQGGRGQQLDPVRMLATQIQRTQAKIQEIETAERRRREQARDWKCRRLRLTGPTSTAVGETMVSLLNSDQASSLQDAYDKAVWLNPGTREKMIASQSREAAARSSDAVSKARKAASSVTGAPTGNAPPSAPKNSLREELEALF